MLNIAVRASEYQQLAAYFYNHPLAESANDRVKTYWRNRASWYYRQARLTMGLSD